MEVKDHHIPRFPTSRVIPLPLYHVERRRTQSDGIATVKTAYFDHVQGGKNRKKKKNKINRKVYKYDVRTAYYSRNGVGAFFPYRMTLIGKGRVELGRRVIGRRCIYVYTILIRYECYWHSVNCDRLPPPRIAPPPPFPVYNTTRIRFGSADRGVPVGARARAGRLI